MNGNLVFGIFYGVGFFLCLSWVICLVTAMVGTKYYYLDWEPALLPAAAGFLVFPIMNLIVGLLLWVFTYKTIFLAVKGRS